MTREKADSRRRIAIILVAALVVAAVIVILAIAGNARRAESFEGKLPVVSVAEPETVRLDRHISMLSHVESQRMVPVVSLASGKVLEIAVASGDRVSENQEVAIVDPEAYQLQEEMSAAVSTASEAAFSRVEELYRKGAVSRQDYDEALARRDASAAQTRQASLQLSWTDVKAPKDGVVLTVFVKAGDTVSQGSPIALIGDLDRICCYADVPESGLGSIRKGAHVRIVHLSSGKTASGQVELVEPYVDPRSKTFKVKVAFDSGFDKEVFIPGCSVDVAISIGSDEARDSICVPRSALTGSDALYYVDFESGKPDDSRRIGIAHMLERSDFEIKGEYVIVGPSGIGRKFVVRGQNSLFDGQKVMAEIGCE